MKFELGPDTCPSGSTGENNNITTELHEVNEHSLTRHREGGDNGGVLGMSFDSDDSERNKAKLIQQADV